MPLSPHSTVSASVHGTLAQRAGSSPDARAVVDAVTRTWQFMATQLEPVIGERGVGVLLDRALHLTGKNFPWLVHTGPPQDQTDRLTRLQAQFASRGAQDAAAAGCALLVTFTELLASLIGDSLTERLLASVWLDAPPLPNRTTTMAKPVTIRRLATGVPGLDAILGGGLPEFSFNLVTGPPGSGKTTLAHQLMFALATPEQPALFFTALGEPPWKMLRYQQQFSFFASDKIGSCIHLIDLGSELAQGDFEQVLARIAAEVKALGPAFVFVDSFRSVLAEAHRSDSGQMGMRRFTQQLGTTLAGWQTTSFLIGEYSPHSDPHPVFTVADGILALDQSVQRNSMVRKIQVMKMRGQATSPGVHTLRITRDGLTIFPSAVVRDDSSAMPEVHTPVRTETRIPMGVPLLDAMLGGGLPAGYSLLVAGPSGSGKTILATAFLQEGVRLGEAGVIVAFEQTPSRSRTHTIDDMVRAGCLGLINTRLMDLSVDEIVQQTVDSITSLKATRVVIDSLSGFELAVAPTFRADFRESLFRMVAVLSGLGVTVLMTSELEDRYTDLRFSPYGTAFLTDAIIVQRYIEVDSSLQRVMAVVKVRGSDHSNDIRRYEITKDGIAIGKPVLHYEGLLGGRPTHAPAPHPPQRGAP